MNARKCYPTSDEALAGAIAQMASIDSIGAQRSIERTNEHHALMMQSRVDQAQANAELMAELRKQADRVKLPPLTDREMSNLILHGEK